jgi:hypothetical protein
MSSFAWFVGTFFSTTLVGLLGYLVGFVDGLTSSPGKNK